MLFVLYSDIVTLEQTLCGEHAAVCKACFIFGLQRVNMSTNDLLEYKFSPLYRVRKVIFILRWCLGFPLKAKNVAFDEMLFRPCVEYARFCAFLLSFAVSISFVLFKVKESNNLESFGAAYNYYYRVVGFTAYDSIAVLSAPYTNMLATVFYLIAFKNNVSSINKICLKLTIANRSLHQLITENGISVKWSCLERSLRIVISGTAITMLIHVTQAVLFSISADFIHADTSTSEKCLIYFAFMIYNICWVYPCITMSADFITCHLMNEAKDAFEIWNKIFKHLCKKNNACMKNTFKDTNTMDITDKCR